MMKGKTQTEEKTLVFARNGSERQILKAPWDRTEIRIYGRYRVITSASVRPARSIQPVAVWELKKWDAGVGKYGGERFLYIIDA